MRVTKNTLLRLAKETVQERAYNDKSITAAYLTGSLLQEDPFLGKAADIDLVFIHAESPSIRREILPLSETIHLDIVHREKADYLPPRSLRKNPWLGSELYDPMLLYETEHFFEFTQASLRAGFTDAAPTLQRAYRLLNRSRQRWLDIRPRATSPDAETLALYFKGVYHAVNIVAALDGAFLTERRLLLEFPAHAEALGKPEFTARLYAMLSSAAPDPDQLSAWIPLWEANFLDASTSSLADTRLHPARKRYYQNAFEAFLESDAPLASLWALLRTWTLAAKVLPESKTAAWTQAMQDIGLLGEGFQERVQALDSFLDDIEEMLEAKAAANGLDISTLLD
jgi:hypothetical protein